jgi:hypothetical protein
LHLRSIVNSKLLVFAQPIDKAAIMLANPYPAITGKRLYSLFTVRITSSWTYVCFAFTIKLVLCTRDTKRAYLLAGGAICLPCSQLL